MATVADRIKQLGSDSNKDLLQYVNECFNKARKERLRFEQQWYMNLAFYFGRQYVQWSGSQALGNNAVWSRLWEPPAPSWRVRLVSNRIRPIIRTELSKVTKEKPVGYVVPASSDDEDELAAKAADGVWDYLWREKAMNRVIRRAMFWMLLCGTSYTKDYWDANKHDSAGIKGDICIEPVSPFHLLVPDLQEEEIENQPYLVHYMSKNIDDIKQKYGTNVQPDTGSETGILEQKFLSAIGLETKSKVNVAVKEIWIKPNQKFKDGARITWAGETLLGVDEGWPYDHKQYPFIKFDHINTGRYYADSVIPDLIPLQKEYNRTRSQIIEAKNRMSKPQLIAPRGSIDPNKVTSEPGLIIFYTPGYTPPQPIPLQNLPGYVIEELDRSLRDMDDISGQHEITKGQTPPGVTAATAISYLQESDDSKLASTVASLEEGIEKIGRHFLSHVNQYWDTKRVVKVIGRNNTIEAYAVSKADVRGNTDFRVEVGSATPRSRAAKQAFITDLMDKGYIPPDKGLRYLDMAETARMSDELQVDARQADRENVRMTLGEQVGINTWDAHDVHVQEHNLHRKRQEFETQAPETKAIFEEHVKLHQMYLAAQQQGLPVNGIPQPGMNGQQPQQPDNSTVPPDQTQMAPDNTGQQPQ